MLKSCNWQLSVGVKVLRSGSISPRVDDDAGSGKRNSWGGIVPIDNCNGVLCTVFPADGNILTSANDGNITSGCGDGFGNGSDNRDS